MTRRSSHGSHWGSFSVDVDDDVVTRVVPHIADTDPSPLLANLTDTARAPSRVLRPTVRRGWWEGGSGPDERRGADEWLEVSWGQVLPRLAGELRRVVDDHGHEAVYAGSYGWASAGRFHNSQGQLRRFISLLGGATESVGTYSTGAAERILAHVVGTADGVWWGATAWPVIAAHTDTFVAFGGVPAKNAFVSHGGVTDHVVGAHLQAAVDRGMRVELFSPLGDDAPRGLGARWHPLRPATDVAVMLGLAHVLLDEGLADLDFCARYCHGTDRLVDYVLGRADGVAKTPAWAEAISEVPAAELVALARRMAAGRTMVTTSWSLQRAQHGEQPVWMSIALAALLGQIGLPGGGFGNGYSSLADIGGGRNRIPLPALPGFDRPHDSWIPVARLSDMLLEPGRAYEFDGQHRTYPDIRLVYWVGGNPFHHHQDLNRLRRAFRRPETVVVHEPYWTGTARHADVVLPATISLERNDLAVGRSDGRLIAMQRALDPIGEARNDFDIFAGLADLLGFGDLYRGGRDEDGWLRWIYAKLRTRLAGARPDALKSDAPGSDGRGSDGRGSDGPRSDAPDFDVMWAAGGLRLPADDDDRVLFADFRADPVAHPLRTPSGRIQLGSEVIDGFGYDDCPGRPTWLEPDEWLGSPRCSRFPLHLIANNPATRLHSQLDGGATSRGSKVAGREPMRMHPTDAAARHLADGDVVRIANDRGACLAGVVVTDLVRPGVVQLSTGAWYDPDDPEATMPLCLHGNPNVLTPDRGTSRLAQGCTGQHALVEVARAEGPLPPVRAWEPPPIRTGGAC